ncbi:MAG TPA: S1 family peptidase [Nannocystaceae bacterium]|nr:S1 family peptidase [Nannocystaceae bacterium]
MSWQWLIACVLAAEPGPQSILDGMDAGQCAWPNVANLTDAAGMQWCTGALVHPLVVVTAAHCIEDTAHVYFGEGTGNFVEAPIEYCIRNPNYIDANNGFLLDNTDFGFCKLAEPVEGVPIIPIAYGCELDQLVAGKPVAELGFGDDGNMVDSIKRFVESSIIGFEPDGEIHVSRGPCFGDSGGPTMMQLADGSWRQIGIHSYVADFDCTSSWSAAAWQVLPFIEEHAGIDVTPCHDIDGTWAPQGTCAGFPLAPFVGGAGDYADGCPAGAIAEASSACGDPFDALADATAPTASFVEPMDGVQIDVADAMAIAVEVTADDVGWGVASVDLIVEVVDGDAMTATASYAPWRWRLGLPEGAYWFGTSALDFAGNRSDTVWISIGIGVPAPPAHPPESADTSSSGDSGPPAESSTSSDPLGTTGDEDSTGAPRQSDGSEGCGCTTSSPRAGLAWLFALFIARGRANSRARGFGALSRRCSKRREPSRRRPSSETGRGRTRELRLPQGSSWTSFSS